MTLLSQLNTLENSGLIRLISAQPSVDYLFRHTLIQEAAYRSLTKFDRTDLHRVVGESIEQLYPDRVDSPELAPRLAQHFDLGQDHQRAIKYYTLSGDAAYDSFANQEAIIYYTRAIELAAQTEISNFQLMHLTTRRGRARELNGHYEQALKDYRELEATARQRRDRSMELHALILQATVLSAPTAVHNYDQGEATSNRALIIARELNDPAAEAKILWNLLLLHRHSGEMKQAVAYGEQAAALAREHNLSEQLAYTLNDLQPLYMMSGQLDVGIAKLHEAQKIWHEIQNLPMLADSLSTEAFMNFYSGNYDRALQVSAEAQALSERIGNLWNQSYSRYIVGYIYLDRGEIDQAIEIMQAAINFGQQAGFLFAILQTQTDLGYIYATLGDLDRALTCGHQALAAVQDIFPQGRTYPLGLLGYISALKGQLSESEDYIRQARIDYSLTELSMIAYFTPMADIEVAFALRDIDRANHIADQALKLLDTYGMRPFRQDALYYKALALVYLDRTAEALPVLEQATQVALSLNSRRMLWEIYTLQADIEVARGDPIAALKLRAQARDLINFIAAHIGQSALRESFLNLPKVRRALTDT